jgi:hypothetical protein
VRGGASVSRAQHFARFRAAVRAAHVPRVLVISEQHPDTSSDAKGTSNSMTPVPLFDLKYLTE